MTFEQIKVGNSVGKSNFPYDFWNVIEKREDSLVVQKDDKVGILHRVNLDKGFVVGYDIQDGEVMKTKQAKLQANLPQPR